MEGLIKRKVVEYLSKFIEFEQSQVLLTQGITLSNTKVKPYVLNQISQAFKIPMEFIEGNLSSITLQQPWDIIFKTADVPIRFTSYLNDQRAVLIEERLMCLSEAKAAKQSSSSLAKRLKEIFMRTLELYFEDEFVIKLQVKQIAGCPELVLSCPRMRISVSLSQNQVTFKMFQLRLMLTVNGSQPKNIIEPFDLTFSKKKTSNGGSQVQMSISQQRFIICNKVSSYLSQIGSLILWHNTFKYLPLSVWQKRPNPCRPFRPIERFRYAVALIMSRIREGRLRKTLQYRIKFRQLKQKGSVQQLQELENQLSPERVACFRWWHGLKEQALMETKAKKPSWFAGWLKGDKGKKVETISGKDDKVQSNSLVNTPISKQPKQDDKRTDIQLPIKRFTLNLGKISLKLCLSTPIGQRDFINIVATDILFTDCQVLGVVRQPLNGNRQQEISNNSATASAYSRFVLGRFKADYCQQLGHCARYSRFLVEYTPEEQQMDEFAEIENFLQINQSQTLSRFKILPLQVFVNHEVIESFKVFKPPKSVSQQITSLQKAFWQLSLKTNEINRFGPLRGRAAVKIFLPHSMVDEHSQGLSLTFNALTLKQIYANTGEVSESLLAVGDSMSQKKDGYSLGLKNAQLGASNNNFVLQIEEMSASLLLLEKMTLVPVLKQMPLINKSAVTISYSVQSQEQYISLSVARLCVNLTEVSLTTMIDLIKPYMWKSDPQKVKARLVQHRRRKQSIGAQFISAFESLHEHLKMTATVSEKTTKPKAIYKAKRAQRFQLALGQFIIGVGSFKIEAQHIQLAVRKTIEGTELQALNRDGQLEIVVNDLSTTIRLIKTVGRYGYIELGPYLVVKQSRSAMQIHVEKFGIKFHLMQHGGSYLRFAMDSIHLAGLTSKVLQANLSLITDQFPIVEPFRLQCESVEAYNSNNYSIKFNPIQINVKPMFLVRTANFIQNELASYYSRLKFKNLTNNSVFITAESNPKNLRYLGELALRRKQTIQWQVHGHRGDFRLKLQREAIPIEDGILLIRQEVKPSIHQLSSNIILTNKCGSPIWIELSQPYNLTSQSQQFLQSSPGIMMSPQSTRIRKRASFSVGNSHDFPVELDSLKMPHMGHVFLLPSLSGSQLVLSDANSSTRRIKFFEVLQNSQLLLETNGRFYVLRCQVSTVQQRSMFRLTILAPVLIVNQLPVLMETKFDSKTVRHVNNLPANHQEAPISQSNRPIHASRFREGVETHNLTNCLDIKVDTVSQGHIINSTVQSLTSLELTVLGHSKRISLQHLPVRQTILTLSNDRSQLQLNFISHQTDNFISITVFAAFVFINLTPIDLQFTIRQESYSYPKIKLAKIGSQIEGDKDSLGKFIEAKADRFKDIDTLRHFTVQYGQMAKMVGCLQQGWIRYRGGGPQNHIADAKLPIASLSTKVVTPVTTLLPQRLMSNITFSASQGGQDTNEVQLESKFPCSGIIRYGPNAAEINIDVLEISSYCRMVRLLPTLKIINHSTSTFYCKVGCCLTQICPGTVQFVLVSAEGVSFQAAQSQLDISFNQWLRIDLTKWGTINLSKYCPVEKDGLRKLRRFFRVVCSKAEIGHQIILEDSKEPPYTFINKTQHTVKIDQCTDRTEQILEKGEMHEFAPRNPYVIPQFTISLVMDYQFKPVLSIHNNEIKYLQPHKCHQLFPRFQQFRDKQIIIFESHRTEQLQQSIRMRQMLQPTSTIEFVAPMVTFAALSDENQQKATLIFTDIQLNVSRRNEKTSIIGRIAALSGYNYTSLQPLSIIDQKKHNALLLSRLSQREREQRFFTLNLLVSSHQSVFIVEDFQADIASIIITVDGRLLVELMRLYFMSATQLIGVILLARPTDRQRSKLSQQSFIIEKLCVGSTSLSIKCVNLQVLTELMTTPVYRLFVQFLVWLGEIKPIQFQEFKIEYLEMTLIKLISLIDFEKKRQQISSSIVQHPVEQLNKIIRLMFSLSDDSLTENGRTMFQLLKGIRYIIGFARRAIFPAVGVINTSDKDETMEKRSQLDAIMNRLMDMDHMSWRCNEVISNRLNITRSCIRLRRYTLTNHLRNYDESLARIQLAIDCTVANQLPRQILHSLQLNKRFVLYDCQSQSWQVCPHHHLLSLRLIVGTNGTANKQSSSGQSQQVKPRQVHFLFSNPSTNRTLSTRRLRSEGSMVEIVMRLYGSNARQMIPLVRRSSPRETTATHEQQNDRDGRNQTNNSYQINSMNNPTNVTNSQHMSPSINLPTQTILADQRHITPSITIHKIGLQGNALQQHQLDKVVEFVEQFRLITDY